MRGEVLEIVYYNRIIAVSAFCGISSGTVRRLGVSSRRDRIRTLNACLVRICVERIDLCDIVIDNLLGSLGSLSLRALRITCLVSLAEFDRELVRAVCDVTVSSYTVAQCLTLFFTDVSDIVVTQT